MKEPERIPLNPENPKSSSVKKIPMPSIYLEPMKDDVVKNGGSTEQAFLNFIQKAKESKKKYNEMIEQRNKEQQDKDEEGFYQ